MNINDMREAIMNHLKMKCRNHGSSAGTLFVELRMTLQIPEDTLTNILDQLVLEKKITIQDSLNGLIIYMYNDFEKNNSDKSM